MEESMPKSDEHLCKHSFQQGDRQDCKYALGGLHETLLRPFQQLHMHAWCCSDAVGAALKLKWSHHQRKIKQQELQASHFSNPKCWSADKLCWWFFDSLRTCGVYKYHWGDAIKLKIDMTSCCWCVTVSQVTQPPAVQKQLDFRHTVACIHKQYV